MLGRGREWEEKGIDLQGDRLWKSYAYIFISSSISGYNQGTAHEHNNINVMSQCKYDK